MLKRLLLAAALLLAQSAEALTPAQKRVIDQGPLSSITAFRSYVRSQQPTMFLDPDYLPSVTYDSSNRVSQIASQVGTITFTQGTDANKPTIGVSAKTGRRMLTFDGVNDQLSTASTWGNLFTASAKTAFIVGQSTAFSADQNYLSDNTASYGRICYHNSSGYIGLRNNDGSPDQTPTSPPSAGVPFVLGIYHDGTNIGSALNRGAYATTASGATSVTAGVVHMGSTGGGGYLAGQLGPIITFNRVLPQPVRDTIRAGLQKFWRVN